MAVEMTIEVTGASGSCSRETQMLDRLYKAFGVRFDRLHPGEQDPYLSCFFHAVVPENRADSIIESLRRTPGVRAAYIKPPAEIPW